MKTQMVTFWGTDVTKLNKDELLVEVRMQKFLLKLLKRQKEIQEYKDRQTTRLSEVRMNKIDFLDVYIKNLEGFIVQLEHLIPRRAHGRTKRMSDAARKREAELRYKAAQADRDDKVAVESVKDGINLQWDRGKFILVARDRGYQTDEAIAGAVSKQLGISFRKAQLMIDSGRFTWGQIMLTGALFEMTPKEFCDIFMAGYFIEEFGEYRASDINIDRNALVKQRILPELPKGEN